MKDGVRAPARPEIFRGGLCGCVLAGGISSRMGRDKALLRLSGHAESPRLIDRAWRILSAICPQVYVASAPGRPYPPYPCLYDEIPRKGPLCGVIGALKRASAMNYGGIVALACDLPLMRPALLRRLAQNAPGGAAGAFYENPANGKIEMLAGIYFVSSLPFLEAAVEKGNFSLYWALPADSVYTIPLAAEDVQAFLNCNTGDDLAIISVMEASGPGWER